MSLTAFPARSALGAFVRSPLGARGAGGDEQVVRHIIAGDFTSGAEVRYWNGTAWAAIGAAATPGVVHGLIWSHGYLFAGAENGIWRFDGTAWVQLEAASQAAGGADFAVFDGDLYVAAYDFQIDPDAGQCFPAVYNPASDAFDADGSLDAFSPNVVKGYNAGLAVFAGDLYLLAHPDVSGQVFKRNAGAWDRITPVSQSSPVLDDELGGAGSDNHAAKAVAHGDKLYIAGYGLVADGANFATLLEYPGGAESNLAAVDGDLLVGEYQWRTEQQTTGTRHAQTNVVLWNDAIHLGGGEWDGADIARGVLSLDAGAIVRPVETGAGRVRGLAPAGAQLLIVGTFSAANAVGEDPVTVDRVALWDGTTITAFAAAPGAGILHTCLALVGTAPAPSIGPVANAVTLAGDPYAVTVPGSATFWALEQAPSGAAIDASGNVSWDPAVKAGSPHTFRVYASNDAGWDTVSWTVTAQDTAPTIAAIANDTHNSVSEPYEQQASLSAGDTPVTWSITQGPSGTTVSSAGLVTMPAQAEGTYALTVRADNAVGSDTESWDVEVTDGSAATEAPVIVPLGNQSHNSSAGSYSEFTALSQGDGEITWSFDAGNPSGMGIFFATETSALIFWNTPVPGVYTITYRATNALGFDTDTYELTVT